MSTQLEMACADVGEHMQGILRSFLPGAKITVIVRPTIGNENGSRDFVMTDDNLDEVEALIARRKAAAAVS